MKRMYPIITVIVLFTGIIACSKKELISEKFYYSKVEFELAALPGTPEMELKYNGEILGPLRSSIYTVAAGSGKLTVYKAGTDTLLADTSITLGRDETRKFTFAYNEAYGIKGWINKTPVANDSMSFQFLNNLSTTFYPVSSPDLYIVVVDPFNLEIMDTITVIKNFSRKVLSTEKITLPVLMDQNGNPTGIYVGILKDPATGQNIPNISSGFDFFLIAYADAYKATFNIAIVEDDAYYGLISVNPIPL